MNNIIDDLYNYDKNLFMLKIYKTWIEKVKISIQEKTCKECHERFNYKVNVLCIECSKEFMKDFWII